MAKLARSHGRSGGAEASKIQNVLVKVGFGYISAASKNFIFSAPEDHESMLLRIFLKNLIKKAKNILVLQYAHSFKFIVHLKLYNMKNLDHS